MNKVIISGRIARDFEIRYTQTTNRAVVNISLAVRKTKEEADFISVVCYGKTAELINQYCKKGSGLEVVGRLNTRNYEDKDGKKVYVTEVLAEEIEFISGGSNKSEEKIEPITDEELPF